MSHNGLRNIRQNYDRNDLDGGTDAVVTSQHITESVHENW